MFRVDENKCTGCEKCVDVCPQEAISMVNIKAVIDGNKCTDCGHCAQVCPQNAIYSSMQLGQNVPPAQDHDFPGYGIGSGGGTGRGMGRGMGKGLGRGPRDGRGGGRGGGGRRR